MSPRPTVSDQANIEQLMAQLDREERTILEVFRTTSKFAVHHLSWETEDPLLNDAKINKSCAHETLRNVLGSLILADQYTKWEIQNGKKPRVDVLLADLGSGNRNSRYKDYINTKPSMQNKDRGRRFLEYGVKYRVFGHLFAAHAGNGSIFPVGIIGVLSFVHDKFRRLRYGCLPFLVSTMHSSKWRQIAEQYEQWVHEALNGNQGSSTVWSIWQLLILYREN